MFFEKKIKLSVEPEKRLSVIHFQSSGLEQIVKNLEPTKKYAIITDKNIFKLYGTAFEKLLKAAKIPHEIFTIPAGEEFKSLKTLESLAEKMIEMGITRSETMIVMGGGNVGDLGGFLASIYMRGMPVIQIPTTLLAMVDAAIGGKTGVNLRHGKNLLGTFHQPKDVFINPIFLKTLSFDQIQNGLAEIIKYGVIADKSLFKILEQEKEKILALDSKILNKILVRSVEIKLNIVSRDEREKGLRMMLNYGHTVGHAIEKISNYKIPHGKAISIGMVNENNWAINENILSEADAERIKNLFKKYELPTEIPKNMKLQEIREIMNFDKKRKHGVLHVCVPKKIGKAMIVPYR